MRQFIVTLLFAILLYALPASAQLKPGTAAAHSHSTGATITITPPAGNDFIYITGIDISNCAGAAVTPAAPTYITTTNITGSPQYQVGSGAGTGLCQPASYDFSTPLRAAVLGTAVTFVLPSFVTNQVISVNVYYYTGV